MLEQELSEMDRVTQLQDAIEQLFSIMSDDIKFLSTASSMVQVNPDIPITKTDPRSIAPGDFESFKKSRVEALVEKAKSIGVLIDALPIADTEEAQVARLTTLEAQIQEANQEYRTALDRAKALHTQVADKLRTMLDTHH